MPLKNPLRCPRRHRYVAVPAEHSGSGVLSKYGLRTATAGSLRVRLNVTAQWNRPADAATNRPDPVGGSGSLAASAGEAAAGGQAAPRVIGHSTQAVLAAFNRAYTRMQKLGDGKQLGTTSQI